jgi:hypothetical protein
MGFFGHSPMNKIMGASSVNQNNNFVMLDVINDIQILGYQKT